MISQMEPWFGEEERQVVNNYLAQEPYPWLTEFKKTRELEEMIADYVGAKHCVMTPNATLALYAMLVVLGIRPGDEVIVPDFTMVATANAMRMAGATVRFVDVDLTNLCLNLNQIQDAITVKTRAILLVDINGRSPDMAAVASLAEDHNLMLLEDAAQALGSTWEDKHLGTFGLMGAFSFSCQKIISTGNGGCVVTNDDGMARRLRAFKDFGRPHGGCDIYESFGVNLKFTDLQAVVGIEQMKKLDWRVRRKKEMYRLYRDSLGKIERCRLLPTDLDQTSPWFVDMLVEERDELAAFLKEQDIGTRKVYPALHTTQAFREYNHLSYPNSEFIAEHGLWLPSSSFLTDEQISYICEKVREFYG